MDAADNVALSTSVLACELIEISHSLATSLSHALCICVDFAGSVASRQIELVASASSIDQSSNSLTGTDRMDCWRLRVDYYYYYY